MQRALVTGATGFIGGHLVEELVQRGLSTRCLVRPTANVDRLRELGVTLVEGDVTQSAGLRDAVADVDVVFHLAGLTLSLRVSDMWSTNAEGPGLVAAACSEQSRPPTLILLSSIAAAGPANEDAVLSEDDPAEPVSVYGRTKRAGETAVEEWSATVPISVVRPGIIFGPRDRLGLPIFKSIATWGIHPFIGDGSIRLSMLYIEDLVQLLLLIAERGQRLSPPAEQENRSGQGIFFAAADSYPTYRELGELIAGMMQRGVIHLPTPLSLAWASACANQWWDRLRRKPSVFNVDKIREASQTSWAVSSEKARRQLGWSPSRPLDEQLRDTIDWYIEHGWLKVRRPPWRKRRPEE